MKLSALDRILYALVTRGWDAGKLANYESTVRAQNNALSAEAKQTFASIDVKATGLLTHTSMMIAGLGLLGSLIASDGIEVGVVILEVLVYLAIAIGCLRCLSVFHTHEFVGENSHVPYIIHRELIIRRELYSLCIHAAIVVTILVFLSLPVLYLWTPGK